jgi:hypothetical protein
MLGRLRMSIVECITTYQELMPKVFGTGTVSKHIRFAAKGEFYDAKELENEIKRLIKEKLKDENVLLLDDSDPCKTC